MICKSLNFLLLIFFQIFSKSSSLPTGQTVHFVSDYFKVRGISSIICYTCSYQESLHFMQLATKNFMVLTVDNYEKNFDRLAKQFQSTPYKIGTYVNYTCDRTKDLLKQISDLEIFQRKHKWLVWTKMKEVTMENLKNYKLNVFCDVTVAQEDDHLVNLYIVYKVDYSLQDLKVFAIGNWTEAEGLKVEVHGTKIERRSNLGGILVKSQTVLQSLKMDSIDEKSLQLLMNNSYEMYKDNLARYTIVLFMKLAKLYNFTLDISVAEEYGKQKKDGEYSGLIGAIERNITDIGLIGMEKSRQLPFLDFTVLLWKNRPIFIFRSIKPFESAYSLVMPFSPLTWLYIFSMLGIIAFALIIARKCGRSRREDRSLSGSFLVTLAIFCQQGFESCSSRLSERIILLTALIFGLIICTFYNSIIVTLALKRKWVTIHNSEDLINSDMEIGVHNLSFFKNYFETSNNSLVSKLYRKKMRGQANAFLSNDEGLALVQSSSFAFYGRENVLYKYVRNKFSMNEICQLSEVELVEPNQVPSPMRKNFFLKEFINCGLVRLKEIGVIARELNIWYPRRPHCQSTPDSPDVSMNYLLIAYVIFFSGLVLSVVIMLLEIFISKRR
ncbi:ionotropic receptor 75a-like [Nilaparvata lugens]|uniref:ionotropic receptor 75a-like n=1 Tax=Nilaparvata lugens TaxID=108931 RepID=UPI00193D7D57|nr:ionotropic receptor 75a-like [Nilaparvata lugens]